MEKLKENNSMEYVEFFRNLGPEDWGKKVTEKWIVKDVLSHLAGWQREVAVELKKTFENGEEPWFMKTDDYADFNGKIYEEFKDYSPEDLIKELGKWTAALDEEIERMGEDKIRQKGDMSWVFDEGDDPHFEHHINQIKKVL